MLSAARAMRIYRVALVSALHHFESFHHFRLIPSVSSRVFQGAPFPRNLRTLRPLQSCGEGGMRRAWSAVGTCLALAAFPSTRLSSRHTAPQVLSGTPRSSHTSP